MRRILCLLLVLVMMCSLCVQAFADDILYCRMCGKKIPADSQVCTYCGEKIVLVDQEAAPSPAPAENKTGSSLLADFAASIPPLPAPSAAPEAQEAPVQEAAPAPAAAAPSPAPAQATDVKTALMQSSARPLSDHADRADCGPWAVQYDAGFHRVFCKPCPCDQEPHERVCALRRLLHVYCARGQCNLCDLVHRQQ